MGPTHRTTAQTTPLDRDKAHRLLFREKTYASVWGWLRRLGVPARDRSDIAQDVFLAGYQSFPTYDPLRARPERWLNRITVHVAAHYRDRAHHRREEFTADDDDRLPDEQPSAEERIDAEQTRAVVMERLSDLHGDERMILLEHDIEGVPMAEIAARHGIPLSTAYKWRTRAIEALRAAVEEERGGKRRNGARRAGALEKAPRDARDVGDALDAVRDPLDAVRDARDPLDAVRDARGAASEAVPSAPRPGLARAMPAPCAPDSERDPVSVAPPERACA